MIDLVTLNQAKDHLRIVLTDTQHDTDVQFKIAQASEIVMDYIKRSVVPDEWTVSSVSPISYSIPALVQAATLLVVGELYFNREASTADVLSTAVMNLLERYRDPALA